MIEAIEKVKLLGLDVDGVLTDGRIIWDSDGRELRCFHVHDGSGIYLLHRLGFHTAIISGKKCEAVSHRAKELSIPHVYMGIHDKRKILDELLKKLSLSPEEVCFVGDDLMDLPILTRVGFPVAVPNGREEVKAAARYITRLEGGKGAVREVAELIIKVQNKWDLLFAQLGWEECLPGAKPYKNVR